MTCRSRPPCTSTWSRAWTAASKFSSAKTSSGHQKRTILLREFTEAWSLFSMGRIYQ
uniref:Uncharacterized protein n=1 Tax=Arundo donax TaxID=35708 RepID=A0A0A8ZUZ6_ARUDO